MIDCKGVRNLQRHDLILDIEQLRKSCDISMLPFRDTSELEPLEGIVGQDRAIKALEFGLDAPFPGYNLFLCGPSGTGKTSVGIEQARKKAENRPVPLDWCYVFNFVEPDRPIAISFPGGTGKKFQRDVESLIKTIMQYLPKVFRGHEFEVEKNQILADFYEKTNLLYSEVEKMARTKGFALARNQGGFSTVPINVQDGEPLTQEQYNELNEEERLEMMERGRGLQERINEGIHKFKEMERTIKNRIRLLEQETARATIAPLLFTLFDRYRQYSQVIFYLEKMQADILEKLELFEEEDESQNPLIYFQRIERKHALRRYKVNLMVDNSELTCAPVVVETNPGFARLFGSIDYEGEFGVLSTDFTKIKGGALHRANGGYLILNFTDVIRNYMVWETLKRVLKNRELSVESIYKAMNVGGSENLEPQLIPLNVKVILVGEPFFYYWLRTHDDEFAKLFKVKAEFDTEMSREKEHILEYASYVATVCRQENLPPFSAEAVARVIDYGTWLADNQKKLSISFNKVKDIILEAAAWASYHQGELVEATDVDRAIKEKVYRSSMIEDKIMEMIEAGDLMIGVDGERIGEINGLAIYSIGDYLFGKPSRITAKTFMGEKGVVNIEREVRMSGHIHTKGVLTLGGYLGGKYAQDKPLSLSASVTFEQTYEGVEGDSASSAELYAIISSLSGVPIKQGIAVTGSVNQNGEIQPIGGVNQKIAGFYRVCKIKGLTGKQGVMIPWQNVNNLMLDAEILGQVRKGMFHIWAIKNVDEGIEILMGIPAGTQEEDGEFTKGSIHQLVNKRLHEWGESSRRNRTRRVHNVSGRSRIRRP
ncbi:MAG: AAA family ATPase [Syntrophomonadaceae bacterium]|nr:AAA family ATPase [Syntrophomonadaceae bacterium]